MVTLLAPAVTKAPTYVKAANFPGLYRHSGSGRYYACKKPGSIRRERSLGTRDRKIAERRSNDWIGNLDKVNAGARVVIEDYRWYYNEVRPHGGIGYRTPAQTCREAQAMNTVPASVLRQELDPTPETDTCTTY